MLPYPTFPSSSALGAFPGFPVYAVHIPNVIDLPSYIASVTAYYGDVFNAPYSNPPKIATWTIWIPNLSGIFSWIINIFLWLGGWIGAVFAYGIKYASALVANGVIYLIDFATGIVTSIIQTTETLTAPAGIWAIPLDVVIVGLLLIGTIMGLFAISKGVLRILEM
jgi:uncharacterized integral membrane protein